MATDIELLTQHRAGSKQAFAELAARHVDWVYSAAMRRVRDAHLAEDVTQAVFMALASNQNLGPKAMVTGWLFEVMRFTSAKAVRAEARRRRHEAAAAKQRSMDTQPEQASWRDLAPILEDAVARLRPRDREVILLRFYRQCSFADMARTLGISEEGARKRVSRTIKKLRDYFAAHAVMVPEAGLADVMFQHTAQPAPAGLAASIGAGSTPMSELFHWWRQRMRLGMLLRVAGLLGTIAAAVTLAVVILWLWPASGPRTNAINTSPPPPVRATVAEPPTYPVSLTFDQIIDGVRRTEREFQNVHIRDFETTVDRLPAGQTQWIATPIRYAGSAWYDSDPRGRKRIYFSDRIMPWEQGTAPWAEDITDLSWDGREGRRLMLASGPLGRLIRMRVAMVSANQQDILDPFTPWYTGVGYTPQYLVMVEDLLFPPKPRKLLSDTLQAIHKVLGTPDIVGQTIDGFDTVRVRFESRWGSDSYWFAPTRGFSLVKTQTVINIPNNPDASRTEGLEVREFKRVGPGIWFPMQASMVHEENQPYGKYVRYDYRAADVVVNDPKFDPAILQVSIPSGWAVDDVRGKTRRSYVTLEDGSEMEIHTGSAMPRMKAGVATRPDEPGPAITHSPRAAW